MRSFRGCKAYVTGGSSGIGKATAIDLARRGASVCISARGEERLESALGEIESAARTKDQTFCALKVDVSDRAEVDAQARTVLEKLGGLDLLINNAGVAHAGLIADAGPDEYLQMMDINYFGTVWTTLAFLPHFRAQGSGIIAGVSSTLGLVGLYGYSAYAASKFAVTGFYDCLRQDMLKFGVQVSVLFPSDTDTPQFHAENELKPPETKAISGNIDMVSPDMVAETFLEGMLAGKYQIVPGFENKFVIWTSQKLPSVMRWYITRDLKKYWRTAATGGTGSGASLSSD